ncbi:MAG: hypothetical protein NTX25_18210 [Proteobacteria bacterium]|nr:hypothetical protein [Pseudomonadota bacterium]
MTEDKAAEFLTSEDCLAMALAMESKYKLAIKDRKFSIEATVKGRAVFVTVTLAKPDKSYVYPVEARILYEKEEMSRGEGAIFLIDYIDTYFEEFLYEEDEQLYLPIDWADHQYEAVDFQIRGQIRNKLLEDMADQLLNENKANSMKLN